MVILFQFSQEDNLRHIKGPYNTTLRLGKVRDIFPDTLLVLNERGEEFELKSVKPVELTYTILLECGFSYSKEYYQISIPGTRWLLVYPTITKNNPIGLYLAKEPFMTGDELHLASHRLTSLHHLMNLYYALSHTELVWNGFQMTVKELDRLRPPLFRSIKKPPFDPPSDLIK